MTEIRFSSIQAWPDDWLVRPFYESSPFSSSYTQTLDLLDRELFMLGASNVIVQLDVSARSVRADGALRADVKVGKPGVILSFDTKKHGTLTYATDKYRPWVENLRAIALGLEALRKIERYGIAERGQQYAGYRELGTGIALGPGQMTPAAAASLIADLLEPDDDGPISSLSVRKSWRVERARFSRQLAKRLHPDAGGSADLYAQVTQAVDVLDKEMQQ